MTDKFEELRVRLGEMADVEAAAQLLHWDMEVNMPPKAAPGRGQQLATIAGIAHRLATAPELRDLLDDLGNRGLEGDDALLVSESRYDYDKATKLPEDLVQAIALAQSSAYEAWMKAREEADFSIFQPSLENMIDLLRRKAEYLDYEDSPYDALLNEYERGMTTAQLRKVFGELAPAQSDLLAQIMQSPHQPDMTWTDQEWAEDRQWNFTLRVLEDMGYDFDAGRQDKSVHPFTMEVGMYDVRVTTRVDPKDLFSALTGSIHEGGHALYEQGFLDSDERTTLGQSISLGIHESQSRLWENVIGISLPFWEHYAPIIRDHYPGKLEKVSAEDLYRAIARVTPSYIRVEADECTYNLHIILRFEIESELIEGTLSAGDVPEKWNETFKRYLGIEVDNDANGCLQDVHWAHGLVGYFPTYALGNLYAAQMMEVAERDLPALWDDVGNGQFGGLLEWLRSHVHRVGRRRLPGQLIEDISGRPLEAAPYLEYLRTKYGSLYKFS